MLFVLAESRQMARQTYDGRGQELPDDAVVISNIADAQGRRIDPANDRIEWIGYSPQFEEAFFYLTIHLDSDQRDQLRLQL